MNFLAMKLRTKLRRRALEALVTVDNPVYTIAYDKLRRTSPSPRLIAPRLAHSIFDLLS